MARPKKDPSQEAPAKPTREESTTYLAGVVENLIKGTKVDERDYKLAVGYIDSRRGGLSETGLNRFSEVENVMSAHKTAREAYPAKALAILTEKKDILLKMFTAKPGQKSITKAEYAEVAPVVEEPFSRRDEKGGLLYEAHKVAKENGMTDVIAAAEKYRETVRVHVLSPLYLAGIYTRLNAGKTVTPNEKEDLKNGITVIENGKHEKRDFVKEGKLTKFGVEVCTNARRMLGGKKGETLDLALQVSDSKTRRSQIAPPRAPKGSEPGME